MIFTTHGQRSLCAAVDEFRLGFCRNLVDVALLMLMTRMPLASLGRCFSRPWIENFTLGVESSCSYLLRLEHLHSIRVIFRDLKLENV